MLVELVRAGLCDRNSRAGKAVRHHQRFSAPVGAGAQQVERGGNRAWEAAGARGLCG
jgi:hypothetical protein